MIHEDYFLNIIRGYKTELDLTNEQRTLMIRYAATSRFVYNWGLRRRIDHYKATGKALSYFDQINQFSADRDVLFPWANDVSSKVAMCALESLDKAFKNFFRRRKKGDVQKGFPKFKSRKDGIGSFRTRESIHVDEGRIKLSCIGWLRLKEKGYIPPGAIVKFATVSEVAGHWFVSAQIETETSPCENQAGDVLGIDLGLSRFATCSDGTVFEHPKFLGRLLAKLKRLSRAFSRKIKGSANWQKAKRLLARLHYKITCQRRDFLHKISSLISKYHPNVAVEDLTVRGMMKNRHLSRAISDSGWGEFVRQLGYKCRWAGGSLVKADRFFPSSKRCSRCGEIKKDLKLSDRTYSCPICGLVIDRDLNAAINLASTARSAETYACGEDGLLDSSSKQEPNRVEEITHRYRIPDPVTFLRLVVE